MNEYEKGVIFGLRSYAHEINGVKFIGVSGVKLQDAIQGFLESRGKLVTKKALANLANGDARLIDEAPDGEEIHQQIANILDSFEKNADNIIKNAKTHGVAASEEIKSKLDAIGMKAVTKINTFLQTLTKPKK